MDSSLKRNLEKKLAQLLEFFPAVIILGVRQCGKTTLVRNIRPSWKYFDLEKSKDFEKITDDFEFFFKENPENIIFDEAQLSPQLFQELRGVIDDDREKKNRFILTGSSSPELIKNVSESLAGRVGILELETLKMNEVYSEDLPPFYQIFEDRLKYEKIDFLKSLNPCRTYQQVKTCFLRGGYPEPILHSSKKFYKVWMDNYYKTYINRDIMSLFPKLNLKKYSLFISMLSSLSGTILNRSEIGRSLNISESTVRDYLEIVNGSFVWRNIVSYENSHTKSILKMPKGNIRDSGLIHFIQNITNEDELNSYPKVGNTFESFIIEELIKGVNSSYSSNFKFQYFRTRNGAEVDLILSGDFGVLPIEIKYGVHTKKRQLKSLNDFIEKQELPFGIVINNADQVEMLSEKIIQIPATFI